MQTVKTKLFDYSQKEVEYLTSADPILGEAIKRIGWIDREIIPDLFAGLIHAIVGQLISIQSARTIWSNMQQRLGEITPQNLATYSADEIQKCGLTMRRAVYIKKLADDIMQGTVELDIVRNLSDSEVIRYLSAIPGVGRWTAEMLLINCMERPDVVSWDDLAIRRGMTRLYRLSEITKEQFAQYRERYSPCGSVASIYLWKISGFKTDQAYYDWCAEQ